jgi:RNA polymerase sigma factor (sigma-70 family)
MVATASLSKRTKPNAGDPRYIYHPSFQDRDAEREYGTSPPIEAAEVGAHLPDDATRDLARRMHYAAYRWESAGTARERDRWLRRYFALRDDIVLGNRKLIFRAVQKWKSAGYQADDLISECHLVLIRVVATYNPWLGIRFSTFAFTCLMRALSRLWDKISTEQKRQPMLLEQMADVDISMREETLPTLWEPLEEYFRDDNELLTAREKIVLKRRYGLCNPTSKTTLEAVGRDLGLSKERIRQLEKGALDKLRRALGTEARPE